jgi:acetoin utilization deacetylase AcuC-like enzyme
VKHVPGNRWDEPLVDVFWHEDVLRHDTGAGVFEAPPSDLLEFQIEHPEGTTRIHNMRSALLRGPNARRFAWRKGRHATEAELCLFHDRAYVDMLKAGAPQSRRLTATTVLSPHSFEALLAGAGSSLEALAAVLSGSGRPAFALVRPPGHHAARATADGYCFTNNVAIVAEAALAAGLKRVAIVDWDVHHGNGTQEGFYDRGDVLTVSLHMDHGAWGPTHPQTGATDERGRGAGLGFNLNLPLPMGSGDAAYLLAFDEIAAPRLRQFAPDLVIVANGLDAGQFDPNGRNLVTTGGFHALASRARRLARELSGDRLVAVLEGGYNPAHAPFCLLATLEGFAGIPSSLRDPLSYLPAFEERARTDVERIKTALV